MLNLNLNITSVLRGGPVGPSYDPDAQAFITAAGITDEAEQIKINNLTVGLKDAGLWTDLKILYPFAGTTSTSQKYNLKNPADTDAAFRLTFAGGWTHDVNGAIGNGVNGYANMHFDPGTDLTDTKSLYVGIYLYQYQVSGSSGDVWGSLGTPQYRAALWGTAGATNTFWVTGQNGQFVGSFGYGETIGNFAMNRNNLGQYSLRANNYIFNQGTDPYTTPGTTYEWLLAGFNNNGTPNGFTDAGYRAFVTIDRNINSVEQAKLQALLDNYYGGRANLNAPTAMNWYYKFDTGALLANSGLYSGDPSTTLTNVGGVGQTTGKFGDAADFDGTNYFTGSNDIGQQPYAGATEWTVCGWFKTTNLGNQMFTAQRTASSNGYRILVRNGDILMTVSGTNMSFNTSGYAVQDGEWHHLAVTMTGGSTFTVYLDGTSLGTSVKSGRTNAIQTLHIGSESISPGGYWVGQIDDVAIYRNRALQIGEVQNIVYSNYPLRT